MPFVEDGRVPFNGTEVASTILQLNPYYDFFIAKINSSNIELNKVYNLK